MNLCEYFRSGAQSRAALAARVGVSPSYLYQMEKGLRSVSPARALAIERATDGAVGRPDLRPADWLLIWPELKSPVGDAAAYDSGAINSAAAEVAHG